MTHLKKKFKNVQKNFLMSNYRNLNNLHMFHLMTFENHYVWLQLSLSYWRDVIMIVRSDADDFIGFAVEDAKRLDT